MDKPSRHYQRWQQQRRRKLLIATIAIGALGLIFLGIALKEGALHAFYIFIGCTFAAAACLSFRISGGLASLAVDFMVPCSTNFRNGEATETPLFDKIDGLLKQDRLKEAWELCQESLRRFPDDPGLWERLIVIALKFLHDPTLAETILISSWERLPAEPRQAMLAVFLAHSGASSCPEPLHSRLQQLAAQQDARRAYESSWPGLLRRHAARLALAALSCLMSSLCAQTAWSSPSQAMLLLLLLLQCLLGCLSIWLILEPLRDIARHKVSAMTAPMGPWILQHLRHGKVSPQLAAARHELQQGRPVEALQLAIQNARRYPQQEEAWMLAVDAAAASGHRTMIEEVVIEAGRHKVRPYLLDGIERIAAAKIRHLDEAAALPPPSPIEVKIAAPPSDGRSVRPRAPAPSPEPEALKAPMAVASRRRRDDREERKLSFWQGLRCSPNWHWISFGIKLPFCLALAGIGFAICIVTQLLPLAVPFFVPLGIIVAGLIVDLMPNLYGGGHEQSEGPTALIGPVESKRFRGDPEGALVDARALCESHPQSLQTWLLATRIACIDLKKPDLAQEIVAEGLQQIEVPADRLRLQRYAQALGGGSLQEEALDPEMEAQADADRHRSNLMKLLTGMVWRLPLAAALIFYAWPKFSQNDLQKSLAILLITGGVLLIAPILKPMFITGLELAFKPIHALIRRVFRHGEMRPLIASAVNLRKERRYEEAFRRFTELSKQFPGDDEIWSHLIEISLVELKDQELAAAVLRQGLKKIRRKHRPALQRLYDRHSKDSVRTSQAPDAPSIKGV